MSLVGPRPSIEGHPYFASKYPKELRPRLLFKPGLTGLAQILEEINFRIKKNMKLILLIQKI